MSRKPTRRPLHSLEEQRCDGSWDWGHRDGETDSLETRPRGQGRQETQGVSNAFQSQIPQLLFLAFPSGLCVPLFTQVTDPSFLSSLVFSKA